MFRFDNSPRDLTYFGAPDGVVAQLVERLNGIQEVRGSNPLGSTIRFSALDSPALLSSISVRINWSRTPLLQYWSSDFESYLIIVRDPD